LYNKQNFHLINFANLHKRICYHFIIYINLFIPRIETTPMFWKKKKKSVEGLPNLPNLPNSVPTIQDYKRTPLIPNPENHKLNQGQSMKLEPLHTPQFPDHLEEHSQKFHTPNEPIPKLPDFNRPLEVRKTPETPYKVIEMEEWRPPEDQSIQSITPVTNAKPLPTETHHLDESSNTIPPAPSMTSLHDKHNHHEHHNKPIFVKVDKFRNARESLETVKDKLSEIDELLKMIREVKLKEDRELSSWEKEMENIKARISHVTTEIFETSYQG
jgi:hypothetical protein